MAERISYDDAKLLRLIFDQFGNDEFSTNKLCDIMNLDSKEISQKLHRIVGKGGLEKIRKYYNQSCNKGCWIYKISDFGIKVINRS